MCLNRTIGVDKFYYIYMNQLYSIMNKQTVKYNIIKHRNLRGFLKGADQGPPDRYTWLLRVIIQITLGLIELIE